MQKHTKTPSSRHRECCSENNYPRMYAVGDWWVLITYPKYIYIYTYIYIHIYIYNIWNSVYVFAYVCILYIYVCMYIIYMYVCMYTYIYLEPPSTQISVSEPDVLLKPKKTEKKLSGLDMTLSLRCFFECWRYFFVRLRCVSKWFRVLILARSFFLNAADF